MFNLEDREICKNCDYKEICAGECEKTIKGYKEIEESHRKENGKLRERVKELYIDLLKDIKTYYIPTSVIQKKIEELNKKVKDYQCIGNRIYQIKVLQELLESEE